jgi:hypothetical protein
MNENNSMKATVELHDGRSVETNVYGPELEVEDLLIRLLGCLEAFMGIKPDQIKTIRSCPIRSLKEPDKILKYYRTIDPDLLKHAKETYSLIDHDE